MNIRPLLFALLCTACPLAAAAGDLRAYPFIHYFDYTEYDDNNVFLDGETGPLLGFGVSASGNSGPHGLRGKFELAGGTVDYDGQTQSGIPHTTDTDTLLYRLGLDYEYAAVPERVTLILGGDYVAWDRDIQPNYNPLVGGVVGGLLEEYRWWELRAGVDATLFARNRHHWSLRGEALYIAEPEMTVVDFGNLRLDLGSEPGFRLTGRYLYERPDNWWIGTELYWEEWEFGRSDDVVYGPFLVHEPRSETEHRGIRLIMEQRF